MLQLITPFALVAALSSAPAVPPTPLGPIAAAAAAAAVPGDPAIRVAQAGRDSYRNGAIIGGVTGAILGAMLGSVGCGLGNLMSPKEPECGGATFRGAALGGALGALLGVGVDAMFDKGPYAGAGPGGHRKGVRVRLRF